MVESNPQPGQTNIAQAKELQIIGNEAYREERYDDAIQNFTQAVSFVPETDRENLKPNSENRALRQKLLENVSLAANKIENWQMAIEYSTYALWLDINSLKALKQRSYAHMKLL